jgi:hypothetical protein
MGTHMIRRVVWNRVFSLLAAALLRVEDLFAALLLLLGGGFAIAFGLHPAQARPLLELGPPPPREPGEPTLSQVLDELREDRI